MKIETLTISFSLSLTAVRLREGCGRDVRPALQPAAEGDHAGGLLDGVHDGGRGRAALEPRHRLLRRLLPRTLQQVGRQPASHV